MNELTEKRCVPCEGGAEPLSSDDIALLLKHVSGWEVSDDQKSLHKAFQFKGFYRTMAFVNAVAWIANKENHHPDMELGYNYCNVTYTTHAINGLSENDFICASKIDQLLAE